MIKITIVVDGTKMKTNIEVRGGLNLHEVGFALCGLEFMEKELFEKVRPVIHIREGGWKNEGGN